MIQRFDHLFKANSPPVLDPPLPKNAGPMHSHYLQSKVVRAKERIEAEVKLASEEAANPSTTADAPSASAPGPATSTPPPPAP